MYLSYYSSHLNCISFLHPFLYTHFPLTSFVIFPCFLPSSRIPCPPFQYSLRHTFPFTLPCPFSMPLPFLAKKSHVLPLNILPYTHFLLSSLAPPLPLLPVTSLPCKLSCMPSHILRSTINSYAHLHVFLVRNSFHLH